MRLRAMAKAEEIAVRIGDLRRMHRALEDLTTPCEARRASAACPILTALDTEEDACRPSN